MHEYSFNDVMSALRWEIPVGIFVCLALVAAFAVFPVLFVPRHGATKPKQPPTTTLTSAGYSSATRGLLEKHKRRDTTTQRLLSAKQADAVLQEIHDRLDFKKLKQDATRGSITEEMPEQRLIVRAVRPDAKVLELGANIGRATCVIASVLNDSSRLVAIEPDADAVESLLRNRDANGFRFHVECAAVSARPLVRKGWDTKPLPADGIIPAGWSTMNTLTFAQIVQRYGNFDTLVADCEGALANIVRDIPRFFHGIHTVVLENDFKEPGDKEFVDAAMKAAGLAPVINEPGGWGLHKDYFFQVWLSTDSAEDVLFYKHHVVPVLDTTFANQFHATHMRNPIVAIIHSCTLNTDGSNPILDYLQETLARAPVHFDAVICINVGTPTKGALQYSADPKQYERATLRMARRIGQDYPNARILYIHTKGVTHPNNQNVRDWMDLMLYWLVERAPLALTALNDGADAVGCNLVRGKNNSHPPLHYSGNFWWTTGAHIARLDPAWLKTYMDAELNWITKPTDGKYVSIFNHGPHVNFYNQRFPREKYVDSIPFPTPQVVLV